MKKELLSMLLFFLGFSGAYLALCFLIPGLRIKLEAPPMEYFIGSLRHNALFKGLISVVVGVIAGALPLCSKKD